MVSAGTSLVSEKHSVVVGQRALGDDGTASWPSTPVDINS